MAAGSVFIDSLHTFNRVCNYRSTFSEGQPAFSAFSVGPSRQHEKCEEDNESYLII